MINDGENSPSEKVENSTTYNLSLNTYRSSTTYHSPTGYPVEFFGSDTDGEKTFEEFYTATDEKDETKFVNLGVVKNSKKHSIDEVEALFANLHRVFDTPGATKEDLDEVEALFANLHRVFDTSGATKEDVVEVLKEYLPNFHHISKGKSLDGRM